MSKGCRGSVSSRATYKGVFAYPPETVYSFRGDMQKPPYGDLANAIFGKELVASETDKLYAPLFALGYSQKPSEKKKLHHSYAMLALVSKSPYVETFSAQSLITVNKLLADLLDGTKTRRRKQEALMLLQTSLCSLDILNEPAILTTKRRTPIPPRVLWQNDPTIDPTWLAWICAFYEQTPHRTERTLRGICYQLLMAGRWLKQTHPERVCGKWYNSSTNTYHLQVLSVQ